jgi:hypothetical protein
MKSKWIWMPHPAHFCGAESCRFRMATYVNGYIVSTIGEWFLKDKTEKQEIGLNRFYETMVFKAIKSDCKACPYEIESGCEIDIEGYNEPEEAFEGHYKMCEKYDKTKRS